jgi:phage baseplate assembly protein V
MGLPRELLDEVGRFVKPMATRLANSIARAVVTRVDDSKRVQSVQLGVMAGETLDDAEHFQPYGFYSVPFEGAEAVVVFPNGDRAHPLVVVVADRRYRPTDGEPGEAGLHNHIAGVRIRLMPDGDIELQPAPGQQVFVRTEGGTADRLVTRTEFNAHVHGPGSGQAAGGDPVTGNTAAPSPVTGTSVLRAE